MVQVVRHWPRTTISRRVLPQVLEFFVDTLQRHGSNVSIGRDILLCIDLFTRSLARFLVGVFALIARRKPVLS